MPPRHDHLAQAQHNQRLLATLSSSGGSLSSYADWAVTVAYYVAVHLVEAYFDRKRKAHSASHAERDRTFASMAELKPIYGDYSDLKNLSIDSRYKCVPARWTSSAVQRAIGLLNKIERLLNSLP